MSSASLPLPQLIVAGVLLPALIAASNNYLLSSLATGWRTDRGLMVAAMAALVVEIGVIGIVCGRWIEWPMLRWLLYGWCWLLVDAQVLLARQLALENIFGGTAAFLTASVLAAQLGLVSVWAVLGSTRWSTRWPTAFVLGSILAMPILNLNYSADNAALFFFIQIATTGGICMIARGHGFRLAIPSSPGSRPDNAMRGANLQTAQFGLGHMLAWTTALALVLSLFRLVGLPWEEWTNARFLRAWVVFVSSGAAVGIVLAVAIWEALCPGRAVRRWMTLLIVTPLAALASSMIEWIAWLLRSWPTNRYYWFGWQFWQDYFESERWLMAWICLAGGMLFASLLYLRAIGYRLQRQAGEANTPNGI
jgi:hypothetical protein